MGATGVWNIDASRHARESIPPAEYLSRAITRNGSRGLERLLVERGLVAPAEIADGRSLTPGKPVARTLAATDVGPQGVPGRSAQRDAASAALFATGDRVLARNMHPVTHTRLPRYVRGHVGTVTRVHGAHVFPDSQAHGGGEDPQWLYTVRFDARELWGEDADPTVSVSIDAFEPYLTPAP